MYKIIKESIYNYTIILYSSIAYLLKLIIDTLKKNIFIKKNKPKKNLELLNKYIEKVIFINLEERKDRREKCELILNKIFDKDKIIRFEAIKENLGAIGCTKSHIACLNLAIKNNWNNLLILEDDIILKDSENLETFEKLVLNKYDVIVFGGTWFLNNPFNNKLYSCGTAASYLVNKHYYKKLNKNFNDGLKLFYKTKNYNKYGLDQYWKKLQIMDNWKLINPPVFKQDIGYSNIEKSNINYKNSYSHKFVNWKKFNKILKKLIIIYLIYKIFILFLLHI